MTKLKQIQGYDHYLVSDEGEVISLRFNNRKVLKQCQHPKGHMMVVLWKDKAQKTFWVHSLMLEAFVRPRAIGEVCRHLNGDPADNRLENLKWGNPQENSDDMLLHGRLRGHPSQFTADQLDKIRNTSRTNADLADEFGVHPSYISDIRAGRRGADQ